MATPPDLSAYSTPDGVPKTRSSVVVYLDVLGFTASIREAHERSESDALLQRLAAVVKEWYGTAGVMRDRRAEKERRVRRWEVKAFTDNVVLAKPIGRDPEGEVELGSAFADVALFQLALAEHGFFVRGGIAVGEAYVDEAMVYGTAILDAYEAEKTARWPRVVLSESAIEYLHKHLGYYASIGVAPQNRDVLIDEDKVWFVNYLDGVWQNLTEPPIFEWLKWHRDAVFARLEAFRDKPAVLAKYEWAARYHNYYCGVLPGGDDYTIETGGQPLRPTQLQDDPEVIRRQRSRET